MQDESTNPPKELQKIQKYTKRFICKVCKNKFNWQTGLKRHEASLDTSNLSSFQFVDKFDKFSVTDILL